MKQIVLSLSLMLLATAAFSQESMTAKLPQDESVSSSGVRIALVSPFLRVDFKASYNDQSFSSNQKLDSSFGLAAGYANLPIYQLGWTANFAYLNIQSEGTNVGLMRLDGNLGTAFSKMINAKAGLNVSKLVFASGVGDYNPGIGLQASIGLQFSKNMGLDLGYIYMAQSANSYGTRLDISESGPELGLTGTF